MARPCRATPPRTPNDCVGGGAADPGGPGHQPGSDSDDLDHGGDQEQDQARPPAARRSALDQGTDLRRAHDCDELRDGGVVVVGAGPHPRRRA
ncbi:hypothetical protein GCM10023200_39250 [Actinomycetospora chlora]|uniref:Uncharacterized protein n=1 Tax=Actinomycetospora chlora TaxID=663608 RepID=A0ABP9BUA9_9PSEU